ncbi:MAG: hypothetical protein J4N87_02345 [Chloroflexi bacterium]|nr:hypothetical protein [Chloroflexota bacterium]
MKSVTIKLDTITAPRAIQPEMRWWNGGLRWRLARRFGSSGGVFAFLYSRAAIVFPAKAGIQKGIV